jgi:hypothetical protein
VLDKVVSGAGAIHPDHQLRSPAGGDLRQRRAQHRHVIGNRVRPGVARAQQHRQRLGGIGQPGAQWMEAEPFLEGGRGALLIQPAVISVASMSMTSQPVRTLPAMASHGNPAAVAAISVHTCARILARAFATLRSVLSSASSSVRRTVVSDGGGPKTSP